MDPIEARRKAKAQLAYLDEDGDGTVDLGEFIDAMSFLTSYLSDEDFDAQIEEQMSYDRFTYKCDAAYLGPKGVLALLPALREDPSFTHLVLRGCGVRNETCDALREALSGHARLEFLDVGENPISEGGLDALVALVGDMSWQVGTTGVTVRGYSNTSPSLEPDPRTGAGRSRSAAASATAAARAGSCGGAGHCGCSMRAGQRPRLCSTTWRARTEGELRRASRRARSVLGRLGGRVLAGGVHQPGIFGWWSDSTDIDGTAC